ncbi:hypothetical protein GJ496_001365 [Pomphorhynchus laevis]|nr:hypothetical protein GJ496_001365 [Pomphorhynchus laevis]
MRINVRAALLDMANLLCTKLVEPYLFLMVLSSTMQMFCVQYLVLDTSCLKYFSKDQCYFILNNKSLETIANESIVQTEASRWNFIANVSFGLSNTIFSIMFGMLGNVLNDRKMVLVILTGGNLICCLIILIAKSFVKAINRLITVVILQLISGAIGGTPLIIIMCSNYLSAVVECKNLTKRFSKMQAVLMIAAMIGPLVAGFSLDKLDIMITCYIAICFIVSALLYTIFILQKPKTKLDTNYKQWANLLPCKIVPNSLSILKISRPRAKGHILRRIILVCFISTISYNGN